jgi:hypothetical protein
MVGKYVMELPEAAARLIPATSLGLLHVEGEPERRRFGFYYTLTRATDTKIPRNTLLRPFLETRVPDGVGLTFDEEMQGWYFPGVFTSQRGRAGDLEIATRVPADSGAPPAGAVECRFKLRMTVRDINEFVEGSEHEAGASGELRFGKFEEYSPAIIVIDPKLSRFNYLRVSETTGEPEMIYHLAFRSIEGRRFIFEGRKYMQKDKPAGPDAVREVLEDYTTLFCHVYESGVQLRELGTALLKFRTFEDLPAIGNLAGFLRSFSATGTTDPLIRLQAQMRFLAFTAEFVQREYDPLALPLASGAGGGV